MWNMDWIEDIISSLWGEAIEWMADFDPNNYSVDAQVDIYPNQESMEGGEMPRYTVEDLKVDIEPMLYDLEIEDVSSLIQWIMQARYSMKNWGWMPTPPMEWDAGMAMPDMGMPMDMPQYDWGGMNYMM